MSAPTADTATLIRNYRDAGELEVLAIVDGDKAVEDSAADERHAIAATLYEQGLGWITPLLAGERHAMWTAATADPTWRPRMVSDNLARRTARVDEVLARCA